VNKGFPFPVIPTFGDLFYALSQSFVFMRLGNCLSFQSNALPFQSIVFMPEIFCKGKKKVRINNIKYQHF
jgi:hypothetical protein